MLPLYLEKLDRYQNIDYFYQISRGGGVAFYKILVINNWYRRYINAFKKCQIIIIANTLIDIDLEFYLLYALVFIAFFRKSVILKLPILSL